MSITFVGSHAALVLSGATTFNFSSFLDASGAAPTIQTDDLHIICASRRSAGATAVTAPTTAGYNTLTLIGPSTTNLFADATDDTNLSIFWKFLTAGDTGFAMTGTGTTNVESIKTDIFRGVDKTTPFDGVAPVTATKASGTGAADIGSITPASALAAVLAYWGCGSANAAGSNTAFTRPAELDSTTNAFRAISGTRTGTAGGFKLANGTTPLDISAPGGGIVTAGGSSAGVVLALRPAAADATLTPSLFTNSQTFAAPTVSAVANLAPGLTSETNSFPAATVAPGAVALTPPLISSAAAIAAPSVTAGSVGIAPSLYAASNSFAAATVTPGQVALLPPLIGSAAALLAPSITTSITLTASLLASAASIHSPVVAASYGIAAPSFVNAQSFSDPTVAAGAVIVQPPLFTEPNSIYGPSITGGSVDLRPGTVPANDVFPAAIVQPGTVALAAPYLSSASSIASLTVAAGPVELQPPVLGPATIIRTPTITPGAIALQAPLLANVAAIYALTVGAVADLHPPLLSSGSSIFAPGVAASATALSAEIFVNDPTLWTPVVTLVTITFGGTLVLPREIRIAILPKESHRGGTAPAEQRFEILAAEDRRYVLPAEDRLVIVPRAA